MERIIIVEDDKALATGITLALKSEELLLEQCHSIREARQKVLTETCDLMLLDINLPDGNGLDFLQEMKKCKAFPIIMITANDLEMDIVTGLELGADDYITKPFSLAILRARVNTQLRKQTERRGACFRQDDFVFDFEKMVFLKGEEVIEFSKTEQKLLRILTSNKGITLERGRLLDYVWSGEAEFVDENALSVCIKRLRDKLGDGKYIKTVYGIGYQWEV